MDKDLKIFIENNFNFLVKLYNRYIKYILRNSSSLEYYASPYMNLKGYPSNNFIYFCTKYYNRKYHSNIYNNHQSTNIRSIFNSMYIYIKLIIIFILSGILFKRRIEKDSVIIHGFHSDNDFNNKPYRTIKTPPLEYFNDKVVYHDINISFISLKNIFKYKKNNILCSIKYISFYQFIKLHYIGIKIYIQSKKINLFSVSYVDILYTLVKGVGIGKLINILDEKSCYINMWENRGHNYILDDIVKKKSKFIHLNLAISFRLAPEYIMLRYSRHKLKGNFLFMSEFNYDLVKNNLKDIKYNFFENYRIECKNYDSIGTRNSILLLSPLSMIVAKNLYKLILNNKNNNLNIKIRLHPYLDKENFDTKYIEYRNIYESLNDYDTIIYSGITTAAIELYFQNKKIYKFISNEFIDIDPLVDNKLVKKIRSINEIDFTDTAQNKLELRNYYLGCNNENLKEIIQEIK